MAGRLITVGSATPASVPIGIGVAMAISEYGSRVVGVTSFVTDVLVGVPSSVTGAFVDALWVTHFGYSGLAVSIALAIIMLPPIIRLVARHGRSAAWPATDDIDVDRCEMDRALTNSARAAAGYAAPLLHGSSCW